MLTCTEYDACLAALSESLNAVWRAIERGQPDFARLNTLYHYTEFPIAAGPTDAGATAASFECDAEAEGAS